MRTKTYYHVCPYCGAFLDPSEHCDCGEVTKGSDANGRRSKGSQEQIQTGMVRKEQRQAKGIRTALLEAQGGF